MIDTARLRITLMYLDPAPWREIEVPLSMSFKHLHDAIQAAFLWQDCHLWEFIFDDKAYGIPSDDDYGDREIHEASTAKLTQLETAGIKTFLYTYDWGDNWQHRIDVVDLFEAEAGTPLPRFIAGEHRGPPEDVGGAPGFESFLEAINNPAHPEYKEIKAWYGMAFDPADIDEPSINALMNRIVKAKPRK